MDEKNNDYLSVYILKKMLNKGNKLILRTEYFHLCKNLCKNFHQLSPRIYHRFSKFPPIESISLQTSSQTRIRSVYAKFARLTFKFQDGAQTKNRF